MSIRKSRMRRFLTIALTSVVAGGFAATVRADQPAPLFGVETIEDTLPVFDGQWVRDPRPGEDFPALRALVSRGRYWQQDRHMEVVARLAPPEGVDLAESQLNVRITDAEGRELSRFDISPPPSEQFAFYPKLPDGHVGDARIEIAWLAGGRTMGERSVPFRVERFEETAPRAGSIRLDVPNPDGATLGNMPVTIGVPFPRGALDDTENLRLVNEDGQEIPLQVDERARWSKFGTVKWVLCDFTVDLDGRERTLHLEYGPNVRRTAEEPLVAVASEGFPFVDAGRLRFGDGLWFDARGDGEYVKVLEEAALAGAIVEHEDARIYRMATGAPYIVEEEGPKKLVLRREGWYREEETGREFCKHITRYVVHRDSPVVRIFHTWIFTGDGNRDRIANMGWRFDLAESMAPGGFLTSFGEDGRWTPGDYLLQWDYDHFDLVSGTGSSEHPGGRAPGVAMAESDGVRLYFGTKDFWQNYPSELEFRDGALWFHNWPRHNRPAGYTFEGELITRPGEAALASAARHNLYEGDRLTRSEWKLNVIQARFAHEGEALDFRLPDRLAEDPIWSRSSQNRPGSTYWEQGQPESANAQGISRTEEMWLYLAPANESPENAKAVLDGLDGGSLRAVVDPTWVARSGAFYEMHPKDPDNYPEEERLFEEVALAPTRWIERMGLYGMWIYGDLAIWGNVSLDRLEPNLYRAFRKRHHGWPYSWIPYARSGDIRLFRAADAATRQNIDANHCHYYSEDIERTVGAMFHRRRGLLHRSTLPWATRGGATTRCYETQADYLWHSWFLTGYPRARDVVMDWAEMTKLQEDLPGRGAIRIGPSTRASLATLKSYVETYEATFDPWFLVAAHAIAEGHQRQFENAAYSSHGASVPREKAAGHFWQAGDREFLRFTGDRDFGEYYLAYADFWGGHWHTPGWQLYGAPVVESNAYAWLLTGKEYYLRRVANFADWLKVAVWDGEHPEYARGYYARGSGHGPPIFTGWALQYFPLSLHALETAEQRPDPIPDIIQIQADEPVLAIRKKVGEPLAVRLRATLRLYPDRMAHYEIVGPEGTQMAGKWATEEEMTVEVPADAPAGTYRLTVRDARTLVLPVVERTDVPEVLLAEADGGVRLGQYNNQVWFMVPEGVEEFAVEIPLGAAYRTGRASVWGPDGERVWNLSYHPTYDGPDPVTARIEVPPRHAGRLWRLTLPQNAARFRMDPQIPPIYSLCRTRWFDPERHAE